MKDIVSPQRTALQNGWHVLYLRPRSEKKMSELCRSGGVKHYLPLKRETRVYQRRRVVVDKPLFPGYIFANLVGGGRLAVLKTNLVLKIMAPERERQLLHELAQIRKALLVDPALSSCSKLKKGHRVKITGGPFLGVEGVISAIRGTAKVMLNIEMIGRAVAIEVPSEYLEVTG